MPGKKHIGKKRILLYYFLAIVLPSIILGALAFRGVINDQAINEKETRQKLAEAGTNIASESDLYFKKIEQRFSQKTGITGIPTSETTFFEDSILTDFLGEETGVEGVFYMQPSGEIQLLKSGLLFYPDETFNERIATLKTISPYNLQQAWELEFREKNYTKALKYYQDFIRETENDPLIGSHLIAVARIQKKLLDYSGAIDTYKIIGQKYAHQRMNGGIPLGVVALMETGRLYLNMGDTLNALKTTHHLLSKAMVSYWELEVSHYNQLISACHENLNTSEECKNELCKEKREQIESSMDVLTRLGDITNKQLAFQVKANNVLKAHGFRAPEAQSDYRVYANIDQEATFLSIFSNSDNGRWGFIYDLTGFQNHLTQSIIPVEKQKLDFQWQLFKEGRELLSQSGDKPVDEIRITSIFPFYLPSWSLVLYKVSTGMLSTFLRASQGIFIYIFLFIVIVLAMGLIFTLQIINKELSLSKMKSDFISTVSHEFKSPLTSIRQMSEMLLNERIKSESRKKEYYAVMSEQSERLSHLIDNILDFAKLEEGQKAFRFEKTNLKGLIDRVLSVFQKSIADEGFSVLSSVPETLPVLYIDKEAIEQVLYNLLDNAYKYSGEIKKIEILAESTENQVQISVKDYGIGIQQEDHHKIFDRFFRGGNELTRSVKGSGIGLTIVKKIIEAHHGTVSLLSTPGKGSTFQVNLPINTKIKS